VIPEAGVEGGGDHLGGASAGAPDDGHGAERGRDAEETERDGVDEGLDVGVGRFGVVEGDVGARVGEGEEVVLERDEVEVLVGGAGNEPDAAAAAARLSRSEAAASSGTLAWVGRRK